VTRRIIITLGFRVCHWREICRIEDVFVKEFDDDSVPKIRSGF